jgi:hypothetical protein
MEGNVRSLETIKRCIYGRANYDPLRLGAVTAVQKAWFRPKTATLRVIVTKVLEGWSISSAHVLEKILLTFVIRGQHNFEPRSKSA